ncbi:MAG TPA: magnesium transporter CorA family protein [Candidatus Limnocylindrales bacterium]
MIVKPGNTSSTNGEDLSRAGEVPRGADVLTLEAAHMRWVGLAGRGPSEAAWLGERYDFHPLALADLASRNQRPKVDDYGRELFIVLYFPAFRAQGDRLQVLELDLFVGRDFVISVPRDDVPGVSELFERYRADDGIREADFARGTGWVVYRIIDAAITSGFAILKSIGDALEEVEADLDSGTTGALVGPIGTAKMNIVDFRRVVRPQRATYRSLKRAIRARDKSTELDRYFDGLVDASERTWDVLEAYGEVAQGLETTGQNLRAERVNDTVRVLTAWSVVFLPLTLIASIFGMNVRVPGEGETVAFWVITLGMVIGLIVTVWSFRRRHWL